MDGQVQPKLGLMVSLILMNLTAIALFFYATPASSEIPKKKLNQEQDVPAMQNEMVMAGDADKNVAVVDGNVAVALRDAKMESMDEGVVSSKRTSKAGVKSPRISLGEAQTLPGKVEMRVLDNSSIPKKTCSGRQTEPPLAIALKKLIGNSSSGVRIFFEGLKNGYTIKKPRESKASITSVQKSEPTEGVVGSARPSLRDSLTSNISTTVGKAMEGIVGSARLPHKGPKEIAHSNQKIKTPSQNPSPTQDLPQGPSPISGPWEDGSSLGDETIPTEIVMGVLSRTQKRTNELIHVFNKKVVPAIERMNDKVAEAIRLEKNLDSYTSALINAINSVVCPNTDTEMDLKRKHSKPGTSTVRKLSHTKPFCSDMSLMRDSRMHDYIGTFSKGEFSSHNKRPVFKTLAARCWHARYKRIANKANKKHSKRTDELEIPKESGTEFKQSQQDQLDRKYYASEVVLEQTAHLETKDQETNFNYMKGTDIDIPISLGVCAGFSNSDESPHQRTIGIEEVLALTSYMEQSSDQRVQSDGDLLPFLSPLNINSNISMSSGMASRSYVNEPQEVVGHNRTDEYENGQLNSEQSEYPGSAATYSTELPEDSAEQARQHVALGTTADYNQRALGSDFSIVCGSRIQGYDSYLIQKEISTVAAYSSENEETQLRGPETSPTDSDGMAQHKESNRHISLSGSTKHTTELVNVFQQLNRQQKEVAMENVCLLVLRIFEAWTDSQRSISSLGLSKISLSSSWTSTDEISSHSCRPLTAIRRSRIDSGHEQKAIMDDSLSKNSASKESEISEPAPSETTLDSSSAEISRNLVQNVVDAAEMQVAERSLMGLKTNFLRNPQLKVDLRKGSINSTDVNQSGFGDIRDAIIADEELAVSKSHESIKVSKESSAATFYTGQPESSEDAFYECVSTLSAGTCGSLELEVEDSSTVFLERIQEEETKVLKNEASIVKKPAETVEPHAAQSAFSIESWLTDSGEELHSAKDALNSEEFPPTDNSSFDFGCGTDDEAYPCSSTDLSAKAEQKQGQSKKKKWTAKIFKKLLKKKSKPSSLPSDALSKSTSICQSDSVLKPNDQNLVEKDGQPTQ